MPLVAFDLDGTLVDQAAAARLWAQEFARDVGLSSEQAHHLGAALVARRPKGEVFAELVAAWSLPMSGDEVWGGYRARMPELVGCSDPDLAALRGLREAGWTLGVVTNGMVDNQEGKIRRTGLAGLIDGWVISEEVGVRKPDRAIFEALAARLGCPLEGWMVGDSLEMDVAGGHGAGLNTVWITSDASDAASPIQATLTAPTVAAAAEAIAAAQPH